MSKTQLYGQKINPYFGERLSGENYLIMFCAEEADGCFWQVSEGCATIAWQFMYFLLQY